MAAAPYNGCDHAAIPNDANATDVTRNTCIYSYEARS